ncbi:hypothetical protein Bbelb_059490 [Branchiostoma belcheri]|nr:hypothetical protein Bbelb_059490 [Branchiostoma belcheri]
MGTTRRSNGAQNVVSRTWLPDYSQPSPGWEEVGSKFEDGWQLVCKAGLSGNDDGERTLRSSRHEAWSSVRLLITSTVIAQNWYSGPRSMAKMLIKLSMSHNNIASLDPGCFESLFNLLLLDLQSNALRQGNPMYDRNDKNKASDASVKPCTEPQAIVNSTSLNRHRNKKDVPQVQALSKSVPLRGLQTNPTYKSDTQQTLKTWGSQNPGPASDPDMATHYDEIDENDVYDPSGHEYSKIRDGDVMNSCNQESSCPQQRPKRNDRDTHEVSGQPSSNFSGTTDNHKRDGNREKDDNKIETENYEEMNDDSVTFASEVELPADVGTRTSLYNMDTASANQEQTAYDTASANQEQTAYDTAYANQDQTAYDTASANQEQTTYDTASANQEQTAYDTASANKDQTAYDTASANQEQTAYDTASANQEQTAYGMACCTDRTNRTDIYIHGTADGVVTRDADGEGRTENSVGTTEVVESEELENLIH